VVAGVSKFGEILDIDHSELANFRKGMNFRPAERIASVTFHIIRAVTLGEEGSLFGFPGNGGASSHWMSAALGSDLIANGFRFA